MGIKASPLNNLVITKKIRMYLPEKTYLFFFQKYMNLALKTQGEKLQAIQNSFVLQFNFVQNEINF
ncbi:hypothetical protein [Lysinibacillus zambalensis]|uniref:hypothetical protein n=1 Tax=Lysinibacillus zambalensis TaxID=3160866 RepID=UPI0032E4B125